VVANSTARTEPPMPQPTTTHSAAWHAAEDAQERAWLDDWMRGRICPTTLTPLPTAGPAPAPAPVGRI
ncbi:hypothetical protein, partial [Streptomyces milbemycinicus]|uniref:hypothetical protein n=2 Tax=Streptomyces TaxID=1883 RepID=UPI001B805208